MTRERVVTAAGQRSDEMTRSDIEAMFARRQEAWENLDAAALAADYSDDCIVQSPLGGAHEGRDAVEAVLRSAFRAFLDLKMKSEELLIDGNRVSQLMSSEGTDMGGFMGLMPSGKPFRLHMVSLYELRAGQIVRERRIYDFTGLLIQLGVLKAKPI